MENANKTKLELYKEIIELKKEISELETKIQESDTEIVKSYWSPTNPGCSDEGEWVEISEKDEYKRYLSLYNEYKAAADTYELKVNGINSLLSEFPKKENMTETEILDYEKFCKEIFELYIPKFKIDPILEPMPQYVHECISLTHSNHWYETNNGIGNTTVTIFGKTYAYSKEKIENTKRKEKFTLKSIRKLFIKEKDEEYYSKNKYMYPSATTMQEFFNLQKTFQYGIFDEEEMIRYLIPAKLEYEKKLKLYRERENNILEMVNGKKQILDNDEFAKEAQKQIDALNIQYEEKLRQFSLMEDDNSLSKDKAKIYKRALKK